MARVALVLGAGGTLGWVYHLGVVEGVRAVIGREPTHAARIIGTSAGGAIAASVLAGSTTDEILASITTGPTETEMAEMRASMSEFRRPTRWLRPAAPGLIRSGKPGLIGVGLLPPGVFPTAPLRKFPVGHESAPWPSSLWIPAVRLDDGRLVVFGRDLIDVSLIDAVEATAAVPVMFRPKHLNGHRYVDGAVRSATNADLLLDDGYFDAVLISSPMSRPGRGVIRRRARRQLRREVEALRAAGSRVVVLEPDERISALAAGFPRANPQLGPEIVANARNHAVDIMHKILVGRDGARPPEFGLRPNIAET